MVYGFDFGFGFRGLHHRCDGVAKPGPAREAGGGGFDFDLDLGLELEFEFGPADRWVTRWGGNQMEMADQEYRACLPRLFDDAEPPALRCPLRCALAGRPHTLVRILSV